MPDLTKKQEDVTKSTLRLTAAMRRALTSASLRTGGYLYPVEGLPRGAQDAVVNALDRRDLVEWTGPIPRIGDAGRQALDLELAHPRLGTLAQMESMLDADEKAPVFPILRERFV